MDREQKARRISNACANQDRNFRFFLESYLYSIFIINFLFACIWIHGFKIIGEYMFIGLHNRELAVMSQAFAESAFSANKQSMELVKLKAV